MDIFIELSIIIGIAALLSILMKMLKQPLVVGYIIAGVLAGPYFFNILQDVSYIELFSKIGIATLLFIVGLSLSPKIIKEVGKVSLITGIGQVVFTSLIGFAIVSSLGFPPLSAFYIAIALTFSSTIIVLKLLSDKGDLNKLYGKISIGFLIVQDILATIILISISVFAEAGDSAGAVIPLIIMKALLAILILYFVSKYALKYLGAFFASSQELLFLFSIAWGLGIASLFYAIGFSMEIGALVAGVALSFTPFSFEIAARLKPLRDFFIVLFFILLGSQMVFSNFGEIAFPAIILSLYILIGNPLIMITLMNLLGYKRKTAFQAGLTVAQISEFSLILVALGAKLGHLSSDVVSLVTLIGLVTIGGSSYLILYADAIYPRVKWILSLIELRKNKKEQSMKNDVFEIALFGYDRVGQEFIDAFKGLEKRFFVVDFNPSSIERLKSENVEYRYGDAEDIEFLEDLPLSSLALVVSTIPDFKTNLLLVKTLRKRNMEGIILVISHRADEAQELYAAGASYVIMPHHLGAKYAAKMITKHGLDHDKFLEEKEKHVSHLGTLRV